MKKELEVGIRHKENIEVTREDTAAHYGSGTLEVFATPAMIALMENTALKTVLSYLSDEQDTVGFEINVRHLKPSGLGQTVECEAILTEVDGKKLVFEVNARDEKDVIGKGTHVRYIINKEKFLSNLNDY
ncbi:MAG: thioesterase family protein [Bacteroidales bacterium]|nr:thioesterase family protein [Bacteroidales bacterium]